MNLPRYSALYSNFHGCVGFRNEDNLIILDFADMNFDTWSILQMYKYNKIYMNIQKPFTQALKLFFNTEDIISVSCQKNTWTALLGSSKTICPMNEEDATFQLYATPYFVKDPTIFSEYLRGISSQSSNLIFSYKNCVLFLDNEDLPFPGGNYFDPGSCGMYRICILSRADKKHVLSIAQEWQNRNNIGIETRCFLSKETIAHPKLIQFQSIHNPYLPEERAISTGMIQKRLSVEYPDLILQDILNSYYRNYLLNHDGKESPEILQQLGLIVEWPFRLTFEGTRANTQEHKEFVALSCNGQRPNRVLYVRYPYEVYTEFNEVPITLWTPVYYVNTFLSLPPGTEKVSVDSVVMGYVYNKSFFCFSYPVLEGRPAKTSKRGIEHIFKPADKENFKVMETFRFNHKLVVNRVLQEGVPYDVWCLTKRENTHEYPTYNRLPKLVTEWLGLFAHKEDNFVDVKSIQMALTLARHKICFQTKIDTKKEGSVYILSDDGIELRMGQQEVNFVNSIRLGEEVSKEESSCTVM